MTDSVVTSPSGISVGPFVKLSIYLACARRFQDKWTTLKHPHIYTKGNPLLKMFTPSWRSVIGKIKLPPLRHHFPKIQPLPSTPCLSLSFPCPELTVQPARWLCCLNPGASWHQGALGEWRRAQSSAVQMNHLGEWQKVKRKKKTKQSKTKKRY